MTTACRLASYFLTVLSGIVLALWIGHEHHKIDGGERARSEYLRNALKRHVP